MHDPNDDLIKPVKEEEIEQKLKEGWHGPFFVGELLPWKGVWFRVEAIYEDGLELRVRKKD